MAETKIELNQTGLSLPIKVIKVGEPPYDGDGWDDRESYYLVDGADGTVLCGVAEAFKKAFEYIARCTNAPVVDAEKLAEKLFSRLLDDFGLLNQATKKRKAHFLKLYAQLILDSIEEKE